MKSISSTDSCGFMPAAGSSRQQLGLGGQRPRDLETPLDAVRQAGRQIRSRPRQPHFVEQGARALMHVVFLAQVRGQAQRRLDEVWRPCACAARRGRRPERSFP